MLAFLGFLLVVLSLSTKTGEANMVLLSLGAACLCAERLFDWLEGHK